jgi:integrase
MCWSELSEDGTTWTIPGERTKNARPHLLPLSSLLRDLIAGIKRKSAAVDLIFTTTGVSAPSGWSRAKRRLDAAIKRELGSIALVPWKLHDLRRTAATQMAEIGIAPHIVEACLNHVSGHKASVAGIYNRATYAPEKKAALERWAAHVISVVSNGAPDNVVSFPRGGAA